MKQAQPGDKFTQLWSREFYNFLLSQIRQDLNLTHKQKSYTYDPVKCLSDDDETFQAFTPVALVSASQIRGGHKTPVIKVDQLTDTKSWGVTQSKCTQTQAADLVVAGVSWCNVTINNIADEYAIIDGATLESTDSPDEAVARIIVPIADGPSLIQFPLPGKSAETTIIIARTLANVNENTSSFSCKIKATITGTPQVFNETITVENLRAGDYVTPNDDSTYSHAAGNGEAVAILLRGMNIIAVKSREDFSLGTGWQWLQAGGVFLPIEVEPETSDPPPP